MAAFLRLPDGSEIEVENGMVLGRVEGCAVVVNDAKASRRHASLISQGGVVELEDLGSSNGTKLNGKAITKRMLRDGDEILIGKTRIQFIERAAASAPAGAPATDFGAGDDLFGDDDPAAPVSSTPPVRAPEPVQPREPAQAPRPAQAEAVFVPEVETRAPEDSGAAASAGDEELLEFADDDVVMVKRTLADRVKPQSKGPAVKSTAGVREGGVLQFSKVEDKGGLIGHDMGQMSSLQRFGLYLVALAVAAGLFYLAMTLTAT